MSKHDPVTQKMKTMKPPEGTEASPVVVLLPLVLVIVGTVAWYAMNQSPSHAVASASHVEAAPHVEEAAEAVPAPEAEPEPEPTAVPATPAKRTTSRSKSNLPVTKVPNDVHEAPPETREAESETVNAEADAAPPPVATLSEKLDVNHKHRIGSCEGVLRVSADKMEYESSHKDAFSVALSEVERFSRDKDTLSVKIRDGRNYNFTERNEDEAALEIFHERVSPALAKN